MTFKERLYTFILRRRPCLQHSGNQHTTWKILYTVLIYKSFDLLPWLVKTIAKNLEEI